MHTEKRDAPDPNKNYETRDVNYKALLRANVIFFAFAIGSAFVGYLIYHYWANPALYTTGDQSVKRLIPGDPNPLLQDNITAKTDIMDMRQEEDHRLGGAPAQNKEGGHTIPIEAAKTLLLEGAKPAPGGIEEMPDVIHGGDVEPSGFGNGSRLPSGTGGNQ